MGPASAGGARHTRGDDDPGRDLRAQPLGERAALEACRGLTREQLATGVAGTYGSLGETLAHIASGEAFYAVLLTGWRPSTAWQQDDPYPGIDPLLEVERETGPRLLAAAESIPADQLIERTPAS